MTDAVSGSMLYIMIRSGSWQSTCTPAKGWTSRRSPVGSMRARGCSHLQAIEVAVRYEYKPFFAIPSVMNYLEDNWAGVLVAPFRAHSSAVLPISSTTSPAATSSVCS